MIITEIQYFFSKIIRFQAIFKDTVEFTCALEFKISSQPNNSKTVIFLQIQILVQAQICTWLIVYTKNASMHTHKDVFLHFKHKNGAYRARTYDPLLVRQMLSQLS